MLDLVHFATFGVKIHRFKERVSVLGICFVVSGGSRIRNNSSPQEFHFRIVGLAGEV